MRVDIIKKARLVVPFLVLSMIVAILGVGGMVLSSVAHASDPPPTARFWWRMPERFGLVWQSWTPATNSYDPSFVNPSQWKVRFDACSSLSGGDQIIIHPGGPNGVGPNGKPRQPIVTYTRKIVSYEWVIKGVDDNGLENLITTSSCWLDRALPSEGTYSATLTVTNDAGKTHSVTKTVVVKDWLIVSIGDSVASGEGNPDQSATWDEPLIRSCWNLLPGTHCLEVLYADPVWHDQRCHRSAKSGPALAAKALEDADPHTSVTFVSFACSGATIDEGLLGAYEGREPAYPLLPPQLDAVMQLLCGSRNCDQPSDPVIDALLITIGANDVDFAPIIVACAASVGDIADFIRDIPPIPIPLLDILDYLFISDTDCNDTSLPSVTRQLRSALPSQYYKLDHKIREALKVSEIYITEYPNDPFSAENGGRRSCGWLAQISSDEAGWIAMEGDQLNQIIKDAAKSKWINIGGGLAQRRHWNYVGGVAEQFYEHGYCSVKLVPPHFEFPRATSATAISLAWTSLMITSWISMEPYIRTSKVMKSIRTVSWRRSSVQRLRKTRRFLSLTSVSL